MGSFPGLHPKSFVYYSNFSWAAPKQKISLLWKLIFKPEAYSNANSNSFKLHAFVYVVVHKEYSVICILEY
jgi:hypothetical protein